MRWKMLVLVLSFAAVACSSEAEGDKEKKDKGGKEVTLDGLKATTPANWQEEKASSSMRVAQFKLPKVKDDKVDGEIVIFSLGGTAKQNLERWKSQFQPPSGKTLDDVSKVEEFKIAGREAVLLDISGTYTPTATRPGVKSEPLPGYRMLAVYILGKENPYQIRLTGPAKTVEHYKKGFEEWVKSFK